MVIETIQKIEKAMTILVGVTGDLAKDKQFSDEGKLLLAIQSLNDIVGNFKSRESWEK